jgi:hypothetical protein
MNLNLKDFGNIIPAGYKYNPKIISPNRLFYLNEAAFKWYNLYPEQKEITDVHIDETKSFIISEIKNGILNLDNDLGYIILHLAGEYLLLLINTWRNTNEVWESVYFKKLNEKEYQPNKFETEHRATYCVWELGIVWHERNAWVRFIKSERDEKAKQEYLNDLFSGRV